MNPTLSFQPGLAFAQQLDRRDPLAGFRSEFLIPQTPHGQPAIYFCGNSLGLQARSVRTQVDEILLAWERRGVEGHFEGAHPWMQYHQELIPAMAALVGAKPIETTIMNTLTVNLHLMMVSFYRPRPERHKVLIEGGAFPSDLYALQSQLAFHGYDPQEGVLELQPRPGEHLLRTDDVLDYLEAHGQEIALVLLSGLNYYTGQVFDMPRITAVARAQGCAVGLDLAHAVGNVPLALHEWGPDFAVWCTYKYLNAGPGCLAGCFVHERHAHATDLPRFTGWWGNEASTRFLMEPTFRPAPGAEGWQQSNLPILPLGGLRASLELFEAAGFARLRAKSVQLTAYLEYVIEHIDHSRLEIITPREPEARGCQLSLRVKGSDKQLFDAIQQAGVICDWREPDCIRLAPTPMYNTFEEVHRFGKILADLLENH